MRRLLNFCRGGVLASLSILAMLALFAAGCNNSSDTPYIPGVQTYTVTVTNGTATPTKAAAGATITVKANAPESGKVFGKWISLTTGVTFASETSVETTFKMPASNVTVAATYYNTAGGIDGLFSVSETKKVYFSKGNLRATYNGSSWTWSFADHQYDAVGNAAANTSIDGNGSVSDNGSVDLFGWVGANSEFTGMAAFGISNSQTNSDYGNVAGEALNDWGTNAISNGGNVANYGWRTLTMDEWNYVVKTRAGADSKKGAATVNNVAGWILLPDAWTLPAGVSFTAGAASEYTTNSYTAEQWAVMESAGAVFLPVTGRRDGSSVDMDTLDVGFYWSATSSNTYSAYNASFTSSGFSNEFNNWTRYKGAAVRLAKDSN